MKGWAIRSFDGRNRWLSNFWPSVVTLDDVEYSTVEHAYQAAKTLNLAQREMIRTSLSPGIAKRYGRRVTMRHDWEQIKLSVMENLLRQKFQISTLQKWLASTGDIDLIEGNRWGDTFWGVDLRVNPPVGENHLGKLLMKIRDEKAHAGF